MIEAAVEPLRDTLADLSDEIGNLEGAIGTVFGALESALTSPFDDALSDLDQRRDATNCRRCVMHSMLMLFRPRNTGSGLLASTLSMNAR